MTNGLAYISERTNQLRYADKDNKEEWLQQLSTYICLMPIKRGMPVSIALKQDIEEVESENELSPSFLLNMAESFIVPTDTSRHEYCIGIALETVTEDDIWKDNKFNKISIHIQNSGNFIYDTYDVVDDNASYRPYYSESNNVKTFNVSSIDDCYIPDFLSNYENNIGKTIWVGPTPGNLVIDERLAYNAAHNIIKIGHISDAFNANGDNEANHVGSIEIQIEGDVRGLVDSTQFELYIGENTSFNKSTPKVFSIGTSVEKQNFEFDLIAPKNENDGNIILPSTGFIGIQRYDGKSFIIEFLSGSSNNSIAEDNYFIDNCSSKDVYIYDGSSAFNEFLVAKFNDTFSEYNLDITNSTKINSTITNVDNLKKVSFSADCGGYFSVYVSAAIRGANGFVPYLKNRGSSANAGKAILADIRIPETLNIAGIYLTKESDGNTINLTASESTPELFIKTGLYRANAPCFIVGKTYYLGLEGELTDNPAVNTERIVKIGYAQNSTDLILNINSVDNIFNDDLPIGYIKRMAGEEPEVGFLKMDGVTPHLKNSYNDIYERLKIMFPSSNLEGESTEEGETFIIPKVTFKVDSGEDNEIFAQIKYSNNIFNGNIFARNISKKFVGVISPRNENNSYRQISDIDITDLITFGPDYSETDYGINTEDLDIKLFVNLAGENEQENWTLLTPGFELYNNLEYFGFNYKVFRDEDNRYYLRIVTDGGDTNDTNTLGICYQKTPFSPPESMEGKKYKISIYKHEPFDRQFDIDNLLSSSGIIINQITEASGTDNMIPTIKAVKDYFAIGTLAGRTVGEFNSETGLESSINSNGLQYILPISKNASGYKQQVGNIQEVFAPNGNGADNLLLKSTKKFSGNSVPYQPVSSAFICEDTKIVDNGIEYFVQTISNAEENISQNKSFKVIYDFANNKIIYRYKDGINEGPAEIEGNLQVTSSKEYKNIVKEFITDNNINPLEIVVDNQENSQTDENNTETETENGQTVEGTEDENNGGQSLEIDQSQNEDQNSTSQTQENQTVTFNPNFTENDEPSALQTLHELPLAVFSYKNEEDKKRYFGIITEQLQALRDALLAEQTSTKKNRVIEVGKDNYNDSDEIETQTLDTGITYKYSNKQLEYIIKQLYMLTNNNEKAQNIVSSIGLLFQSAKETQDRLLALEASTFGKDSPTIPGNPTIENIAEIPEEATGIKQQPTTLGLNRLIRALSVEVFGTADPVNWLDGNDDISEYNLSRIDRIDRHLYGDAETASGNNTANINITSFKNNTSDETTGAEDKYDGSKDYYPKEIRTENMDRENYYTYPNGADTYTVDDGTEDENHNHIVGDNFTQETLINENGKISGYKEPNSSSNELDNEKLPYISDINGVNDAINRIVRKLDKLTENVNGDRDINRRPELLDRMRDNIETLIEEVFDNDASYYKDDATLQGDSFKKSKLSRIDNALKDLYYCTNLPTGNEYKNSVVVDGITDATFNGKKLKLNETTSEVNGETVSSLNGKMLAPEVDGDYIYGTIIDIIIDLICGSESNLIRKVESNNNKTQNRASKTLINRIAQLEATLDAVINSLSAGSESDFENYDSENIESKGLDFIKNIMSYLGIENVEVINEGQTAYKFKYEGLNHSFEDIIQTKSNGTIKNNGPLALNLHNAVFDIAARLKAKEYSNNHIKEILGEAYSVTDRSTSDIKTDFHIDNTTNDKDYTVSSDMAALLRMVYGYDIDKSDPLDDIPDATSFIHFNKSTERTEDFITNNGRISNIEYLFEELYKLPNRVTKDGLTTLNEEAKTIDSNEHNDYNNNIDDKNTNLSYYAIDDASPIDNWISKIDDYILNNGKISTFKGIKLNRFDVIEEAIKAIRKSVGMDDTLADPKFTGEYNVINSFNIINSEQVSSLKTLKNTWNYGFENSNITVTKVIPQNLKIGNRIYEENNPKYDVLDYICGLQNEINTLNDYIDNGYSENYYRLGNTVIDTDSVIFKTLEGDHLTVDDVINLFGISYNNNSNDDNHNIITITKGGESVNLTDLIIVPISDNRVSEYIISTENSINSGLSYKLFIKFNKSAYLATYTLNKKDGLLHRVKELEKQIYGYDDPTGCFIYENGNLIDLNPSHHYEGIADIKNKLVELEETANSIVDEPSKFHEKFTYVVNNYRDLYMLLAKKSNYKKIINGTPSSEIDLDFATILFKRNEDEESGVYILSNFLSKTRDSLGIITNESIFSSANTSEESWVNRNAQNGKYLITNDSTNISSLSFDFSQNNTIKSMYFEDIGKPIIEVGILTNNNYQKGWFIGNDIIDLYNLSISGYYDVAKDIYYNVKLQNFNNVYNLKIKNNESNTYEGQDIGDQDIRVSYINNLFCDGSMVLYLDRGSNIICTGSIVLLFYNINHNFEDSSYISNVFCNNILSIESFKNIFNVTAKTVNLIESKNVNNISCENLSLAQSYEINNINISNSAQFYECDNINGIEYYRSGNEALGSTLFERCNNITNVKTNFNTSSGIFIGCKNISNVKIEGTSENEALINCENISNCNFGQQKVKYCKNISNSSAGKFEYCGNLHNVKLQSAGEDNRFEKCQTLISCEGINTEYPDFVQCTGMSLCKGTAQTLNCFAERRTFITDAHFNGTANTVPTFPSNMDQYNVVSPTAFGGWNEITDYITQN